MLLEIGTVLGLQCLWRVKGLSLLIGHYKYNLTYLLTSDLRVESAGSPNPHIALVSSSAPLTSGVWNISQFGFWNGKAPKYNRVRQWMTIMALGNVGEWGIGKRCRRLPMVSFLTGSVNRTISFSSRMKQTDSNTVQTTIKCVSFSQSNMLLNSLSSSFLACHSNSPSAISKLYSNC